MFRFVITVILILFSVQASPTMPSRFSDYNANQAAPRKAARIVGHELARKRFETQWGNGSFDREVMDPVLHAFHGARIPVGTGEIVGAPVTIFIASIRRFCHGHFVRCARIRGGRSPCAICTFHNGQFVCVPLIYVYQSHIQ